MQKKLYRIIREATGNSIRHGRCSSLKVSLKECKNSVKLTIDDNGNGFNASEKSELKQGIGLINMQELIRSLGGFLELSSQKGKGTKLCCEIPLFSQENI